MSGGGGGISLTSGGKAGLYNTIVAGNLTGAGQLRPDQRHLRLGRRQPRSQQLVQLDRHRRLRRPHVRRQHRQFSRHREPGLASSPQDNGGPTPTIALLAGSPAIDTGSATIIGVAVPDIDQRGAVRGPLGLDAGSEPDIGAYEASSSYLVSTTADTADVGTIGTAVNWANQNTNANPEDVGNTAANTIVFDQTGVFATPQTLTVTGVPLALRIRAPQRPSSARSRVHLR